MKGDITLNLSKRLFAILLALLLIPSISSFAQVSDDYYACINENIITVGGSSMYGEGHMVTAMISCESEMVYFNFAQTDSDGNFKFVCTLDPDTDDTGDYDVVIGFAGHDAVLVDDKIVFVNAFDTGIILDEIKQCSTIDDLTDLIGRKNDLLQLDMEGNISTLTDADKVYNFMLSQKQNYTGVQNFREIFETAVAIQLFNESSAQDASELLALNEKVLGIDLEGIFADIKNDELRGYVYDAVCSADIDLTAEDFHEVYEKSVYTALLNGLDTSDREKLIDYAEACNDLDYAESNLSGYGKLSQKNQIQLIKNMIDSKNDDDFDDLEDAAERFDDEVDDLTPNSSPSDTKPSKPSKKSPSVSISVQPEKAEDKVTGETSVPVQVRKFKDLSSVPWAVNQIEYLVQKGIVDGRSSDTFDPDGLITREEFVKLLIGALDVPDYSTENTFADVREDDWFYKPVMKAYAAGIINGVDYEKFGTGQPITREQVCAIIYRAMLLKNAEIEVADMSVYIADAQDISEYAVQAVEAMFRSGIVNGIGDGCFNPGGYATRAQTAKIIYEVLERIGEI